MPGHTDLPDHLQRPHVRRFQPLPLQKDGQTLAGLRDPCLISPQMMVVPPPVLAVVAQFDGRKSLNEISRGLNIPMDPLVDLVKQLDSIGMLWGPSFERMEQDARDRLHKDGAFPATASAALGESAETCRQRIEGLLAEAEDPELDAPLIGVVAPHIDFDRGGAVYAAAYRATAGLKPDRVVILGTNHFGPGDGVIMSRLGFETPMGRSRPDEKVMESLVTRLGDRLVKDEMDHLGEHSIGLHLPWIKHVFGEIPVVAALVPDPNIPLITDDGARVSTREFAPALQEALVAAGGKSFFIASADLSHVGPQFGDPRPVDERRQDEVEQHDREMLGLFQEGDAEAFAERMKELANPTRWCSVGNMYATLIAARPVGIELIEYRQHMDPKRLGLVASAAVALTGRGP